MRWTIGESDACAAQDGRAPIDVAEVKAEDVGPVGSS